MACNNRPTLQTYDEDASDGFTSPYTPALSEACYSFVACGYVGGCIDAGPDYTSPLPCNDLTYHSSQTESWTDAFGTTTNYTDYVSCDCTSVASATDTGCGELEMYLFPFCHPFTDFPAWNAATATPAVAESAVPQCAFAELTQACGPDGNCASTQQEIGCSPYIACENPDGCMSYGGGSVNCTGANVGFGGYSESTSLECNCRTFEIGGGTAVCCALCSF